MLLHDYSYGVRPGIHIHLYGLVHSSASNSILLWTRTLNGKVVAPIAVPSNISSYSSYPSRYESYRSQLIKPRIVDNVPLPWAGYMSLKLVAIFLLIMLNVRGLRMPNNSYNRIASYGAGKPSALDHLHSCTIDWSAFLSPTRLNSDCAGLQLK